VKKVLIILCLLSLPVLFSTHIPPNIFYPAGFISLTIPIFIGVLILSFFYFIFNKSWWSILPIFIITIFWSLISSSFSFHQQDTSNNRENSIRLISYNVQGFIDDTGIKTITERQTEISDWIDSLNADIICLQEVTDQANLDRLLSGYQSFFSGKTNPDNSRLGVIILSRFPIVNSGSIEFAFNSFNRSAWADIAVGKDTIRVMNVHLKSYNFKDYKGWKKITNMRNALQARSYHARLLTRFIQNSPYPVILCGDFNETSNSYVYQKLKTSLNNSFEHAGKFYQHSFKLGPIPFRIDHIFADTRFTVLEYNTHYECHWSDHYPIDVTLKLEK